MTPQERRAKAAQSCIDRFSGKPLALGQRDCARMAAHLLHHLGIGVPFLKGRSWSSEAGALRVLKRTGFATVHEAVDSLGLSRIGWASARVGDLIALPTSCPMGALGVHVGSGAVLCYRDEEEGAVIVRLATALFAWRTL